jgi:hypothetical protein
MFTDNTLTIEPLLLGLKQMSDHGLHEEERSPRVGVEQFVVAFHRGVDERAARRRRAGIHQCVDRAETLQCSLDRAKAGVWISHVGRDENCFSASLLKLGNGCLALLRRPAQQRKFAAALADELARHGQTKTLRAAGDDGRRVGIAIRSIEHRQIGPLRNSSLPRVSIYSKL